MMSQDVGILLKRLNILKLFTVG